MTADCSATEPDSGSQKASCKAVSETSPVVGEAMRSTRCHGPNWSERLGLAREPQLELALRLARQAQHHDTVVVR